jgi:transposase
MRAKQPKPEPEAKPEPQARKPRGTSIDHERAKELLGKGLKVSEIAQILKCTEGSIYKIKAKL